MTATTQVLCKLFARGFYRAHSGLFFSFFTIFGMYLVFVQVLNQSHLNHKDIIKHNLLIVIEVASSPAVAGLLMITWLLITIKSWAYISQQMARTDHQFLFYSISSFHKARQFKIWLFVQLAIASPMLVYVIFALVIGFIYNFYLLPVLVAIFTLSLCLIGSVIHSSWSNKPIDSRQQEWLVKIMMRWRKPLFSLFLFHLLNKLKISFVVTKVISFTLLAGGFYLLSNVDNPFQLGGIIVLGTAMVHSFLLYESFQFELERNSFVRNFPVSKMTSYVNWLLVYLLLTTPESFWIISKFEAPSAIWLLLLNWGTGMLLRSFLYLRLGNMGKYLRWVFFLFIILFFGLLANLLFVLITLNALLSMMIFHRFYYRQGSVTSN